MLEFAHPWLFLLLPLPLFVRLWLPPYLESKDSIQVPFFRRLVAMSDLEPGHGAVLLRRILPQKILVPLSWALFVIAMARPEWVGEPVSMTRSARDLMIAVDLSGSMEARDFSRDDGNKVDRLQAVKDVLGEFVALREHDRLGLILFGDAPYLQAPFTEDRDTWLQLLQETEIGMAGQRTVFGDAIGLAIRVFDGGDADNRVLIALTDGNDTGSRVPPEEAAKVAAAHDIRVYTIAIGDPATVGEEALDLEVLEAVAKTTGGGFYQALDRDQLQQVYQRINELEPEEYETLSYRPRRSLHLYPFLLVFALYLPFHWGMTLLTLLARRRARTA